VPKAASKPSDATAKVETDKAAKPVKVPHAAPKSASGSPPAKAASGSPPAKAASGSPPAKAANGEQASVGTSAPAKKLDLASITELQKKLEEDKDRLELFVIKAKREHDENKESKEKHDEREREYYRAELGMPCGPGNRFLIEESLGKGVFSTVYRCKDMGQKGKDFAIKFIRNNAMCRRATEKEIKLMRKLRLQASVSDPEGASRLLGLAGIEMFEQEGHLAVVLQLMKCDLRSGLRKYGQGCGLHLAFVHTFARDIFLALRALRSIKVVHTDLKPDNLLMSMDKMSVRLSDFGSAMDTSQAEKVSTDYLQPRFYRAPEVILGQPYTTQIDMWSAGATLYEIATDRTLFRGDSNNGMIHAMLQVCGPAVKTLATSGKFASKHFTESGDFMLKDKGNSSMETLAMSTFEKPSPSVRQMLEEALAKQPVEPGLSAEAKARADARAKGSMQQLADLICKCCALDPAKRATPKDALAHPFAQKAAKAEPAKTAS